MSTSAASQRQDRPIPPDRKRRRRPAAVRLESLEPRQLLASLLVTTNVDTLDSSDNALSLREAILVSNGTLPVSALSPAEQGLVSGGLSAPAQNTIYFEAPTLQLLPQYNQVSDLPSTGDSRVDISSVQGIGRYVRIFNASGQMTFDGSLASLVPSPQIVDLNTLLDGLYAKASLTQADVDNVFRYTFLSNNALLPMYIRPTTPLPTITAPVQVFGGGVANSPDKPDVNLGNPYTRIDGSGLVSEGLVIQAPNCTVANLIITAFTGAGVTMQGASAQGNSLFSSFIGTVPRPLTGRDFSNAAGLRNGVGLYVAASNNRIGGNTPGLPSVIANNGVGVRITGPLGTGTLVQGNFILDNLAQGVYIDSSNNTIGEALAGGGNVISGNGAEGVLITGGPDVQGNNLLGNWIGTDLGVSSGDPPKGAFRRPNGREGVLIDGSPKNIVGGGSTAARNIIGGNLGDGVRIVGASASGNRVQGNWIGFNIVNGLVSLDLANKSGVVVEAPGNDVGGSGSGEGNVISLNRAHGVHILGNLAAGTSVLGNTIGMNPDRGSDFGNTWDGVRVTGAANTLIGGATDAARNYISGNNHGIMLEGVDTTGTRIQGNFIGTAGDGTTDLGNAVNGVYIVDGPLNTIGGTDAGAGNVISGNNRGVVITGVSARNNAIQGNFIGTDLTGTVVINNEIDGVLITGDAPFTAVGGTLPGEANTIAFNAGDGVHVDSGVGNAIRSNLIHDNRGLGINLIPAGGANNAIATPGLTAAEPRGTRVLVHGTFAVPGSYDFDFFASADKGPSGNGQLQPYQAQRFLGRARLVVDAAGTFTYELPTLVTSSEWITVTATDAQGDTSEISNPVRVPTQVQFSAASYTVRESDGSIVVTVNRTGGLGGGISVAYSTADGTAIAGADYSSVSGTLFFLSNETQPKSFTIPILDTARIGGSTNFRVILSDATNGASLGSPATATVTINDDDQGIKFATPAVAVDESAPSVTIQVTRPSGVGTATVSYATVDGTARAGVNYVAKSGVVTFGVGETSKPVTVALKGDNAIAGPLGFTIALSNPVGGLIEPPGTVSVVINDVDSPGVIAFSSATASVAPEAGAATLTVRRTVGKGGTVSVSYATIPGTGVPGVDYTPVSGVVTFGPGETSKTINVPILARPGVAGTSTFVVALSGPVGGATLGPVNATTVRIQRTANGGGGGGTPVADVSAPTVVRFTPVAGPRGVTSIVIGFSEPVDPNRAQNLANYGGFVVSYGRDNIPNTRDDSKVAITAATYDAAARTVTLRLATSLNESLRYYVTLNRDAQSSPGRGIADLAGNLLAGDGRNAGTPYTGTIGTTPAAPTPTRGRVVTPAPTRGRITARAVDRIATTGIFPRTGSLAAWARR